jgi:hypothetical protein
MIEGMLDLMPLLQLRFLRGFLTEFREYLRILDFKGKFKVKVAKTRIIKGILLLLDKT